MKNKVKRRKFKSKSICAVALLTCTFILSTTMAQEAIPASGGNASGSGGSVSYTTGQVINNTYSGTNGSIAQGVQQPYEISVVTGIEEAKDISLQCFAFPNPANDFLTLKLENYKTKNLTYHIYDINGKLLESKEIIDNETKIAMSNLLPSIYFLKLNFNKKEIKSFKIIKN